ncbi:MAG: YebC/PmpR family DNA-binding transcriptional regulator, partial [Treponema sp.]|nr:YebC/PmpR family DNA-binding transcriptional regulator [Treponema sp.]
IEITTTPEDFEKVLNVINEKGIETTSAEVSMVADVEVSLDVDAVGKVVKLIDRLEENEDVQNVYSNLEIPEGFESE